MFIFSLSLSVFLIMLSPNYLNSLPWQKYAEPDDEGASLYFAIILLAFILRAPFACRQGSRQEPLPLRLCTTEFGL